jgi:hypothetical protein
VGQIRLYGGVIVRIVPYFHHFLKDLHQICTSGDAGKGNPDAHDQDKVNSMLLKMKSFLFKKNLHMHPEKALEPIFRMTTFPTLRINVPKTQVFVQLIKDVIYN